MDGDRYHGPVSVFFFMAATVIFNICLLNLLIAIVSNQFDEYMYSAGFSYTLGRRGSYRLFLS